MEKQSDKELQKILARFANTEAHIADKSYFRNEEIYAEDMTSEQVNFCKHHGIKMKYLLNAKNMSTSEWKNRLEAEGKVFAYNTSICRRGHNSGIRSKSGHCVECNPSAISHSLRSHIEGIVYIAQTDKGGIIKVGMTSDYVERENSLNRTEYAGYNDWELLYATKVERAGKIEDIAQQLLSKYSISKLYDHDSHLTEAYELFSCNPATARAAIEEACKSLNVDGNVCFDFTED